MFDAGVDGPLSKLVSSARSLAAEFEGQNLEAHEAARLVEQCAEAERLLAAIRVFAASTLEDKALWRREGFRSVAAWMAAKTGTAVGPSIDMLQMADRLAELPKVAAAFRAGLLSAAQASAIAEVAAETPHVEEQLLEAAGKLSLRSLQEECRRVEAAVTLDEDEKYRRAHRKRSVRTWVDRDGVGHLSARLTTDALARFMNEVERRCSDIMVDAIKGRWFERREAHLADALVDLVRPGSATPPGPDNTVHVVVDYEALMRGHTVAGERCEIPCFGPIPVTLARQMTEDAILKVLLTRGVDVMAVAHGSRTIRAHLRTALEVRDRKCIVPRCDRKVDLQIDHRNAFGRTQVTKLEDLALLCRRHHYLKTFLGYTYRGRPGAWEWIPPENLDLDLRPLSKMISSAQRC